MKYWTLPALLALVAHAPAAPEESTRVTFGASLNELGVRTSLDRSRRWDLSESDHPLLNQTHFTLGASGYLSPSYSRLQAWAVLAPVSVLEIRGGLEPAFYFGTFTSLIGFESYDDDFSSDERQSGFGMRAHVGPRLQFAVGRFAVRSSLSYEYWRFESIAPYVYEPTRDTLLLTEGDTVLHLDSIALLNLAEGRTRLGVRHQFIRVSNAPQNDISRVGPVLMWKSAGRWLGLNKPRVFANVFYYLNDRSKQDGFGAILAISLALGGR